MILIKFFVVLIFWISKGDAYQCNLSFKERCVFSGVLTTNSDQYFYLSSTNNSQVKLIEFKESTIQTLTNEICEVFPNLEELIVEKVALEKIASNALKKCKKLKIFSVRDNKLTEVDRNLFKENVHLVTINFEKNLIKQIDGRMFENLTELKEIYFTHNLLTEFPVHKFPALKKMKFLYISENELTDLDANKLADKFPRLESIDINSNLFDCNRLKLILGILKKNHIKIEVAGSRIKSSKYDFSTSSMVEHIYCLTEEEQRQRELLKEHQSASRLALVVILGTGFVILVIMSAWLIYKKMRN